MGIPVRISTRVCATVYDRTGKRGSAQTCRYSRLLGLVLNMEALHHEGLLAGCGLRYNKSTNVGAVAQDICSSCVSPKDHWKDCIMRLQTFAAPDNWTIVGDAEVRKDNLARYYIDGARVAIVRPMGVFTALVCADGGTRYVMTSDWSEAEHLEGRRSERE